MVLFCESGRPDPRASFPDGLARRIDVLRLPPHSPATLPRAARNLVRFVRGIPPLNDRFAGYERPLARLLAGRSYDLALIEHFWCAPYAAQIERVSRRVAIDMHNVESTLLARTASVEGVLAAPMFRRFAQASSALERAWLPRFALTLAASQRDAEEIERLAPGSRVSLYPNTIPSCPPPSVEKQDAIVFSGNLAYHPNRAAVKFFARHVWPGLRKRWPLLHWRIVGKNPEAVLDVTGEDPRIDLTGPVEDAVAELAQARLAVVPLLSGSGTRIKILEAWAAGLPVVSTSIGAEGLEAEDGRHLMLADTPDAIRNAVSELLGSCDRREEMGLTGRRLYEEKYTWQTAWRRLEEAGL